jgi:hypothetical protein
LTGALANASAKLPLAVSALSAPEGSFAEFFALAKSNWPLLCWTAPRQ